MRVLGVMAAASLMAAGAQGQLIAGFDDTPVNIVTCKVYDFTTNGWVDLFAGTQVWGLAADDTNQRLYIAANGNNLYTWNYSQLGTGTPANLQGTFTYNAATVNFVGLAWDNTNQILYAIRNIATEGLYTVDPTTRVATLLFTYNTAYDLGGLEWNPTDGQIYATNDATGAPGGSGLFRFDLANQTLVPVLNPYPPGDSTNDIDGLAIGVMGGQTRAYFIHDDPGTFNVYNLTTSSLDGTIPSPWSTAEVFAGGAWSNTLLIPTEGVDVVTTIADPADCSVAQGGTVTYTITVANQVGPDTANDITLVVTLPAGTTFQNSTPPGTPVGNTLTLGLGSLAANASTQVTVNVTADVQGSINLAATASTTSDDRNPANNTGNAATLIRGQGPSTATIMGVISTVPTHATSLVPGMGGVRFQSTGGLDRPFPSPDRTRFIMSADSDIATTTQDHLLLVGTVSTPGVTVVAQEGVTVLEEGDRVGIFDTVQGINNAGQYVFSTNTDLTITTQDEVVVKWNGTQLVTVAREGQASPSTGGTYGATSQASGIAADGTIAFNTNLAGLTTATDTALIRNDGNTLVAQEGTTIPGGQDGGTTFTYKAFDTGATDGQGWFLNSDHSQWIASCTINHTDLNFDRLAVVSGTTRIQENVIIAGSAFTQGTDISTPLNQVEMDSNGDWFAYGDNNDDNDWVECNGSVVAATDAPIVPASSELWDDAPYAQTFFLAIGNGQGDYVVGGTTNSGNALSDAVLVLNGTTVIARENDPVDLDANGQFDDGVYLSVFRDDYAFMTATECWIVVRSRDEANAFGCGGSNDIGQALVRIPLGGGGPQCPWSAGGCVADYNGSGGTPDDADVAAFFAAWNAGDPCADANGSGGTPDDADIATFFALWNAGGC